MSDQPRFATRTAQSARIVLLFVDLRSALPALETAEHATPRLSDDERARYENRAGLNSGDAKLWRGAHIALRIALEREAGIGVRGVPFETEPGGRPRLAKLTGGDRPPHFSLAHAGDFALLAISNTGPAGVDLEITRTLNVSAERRARIETAARRAAPEIELDGADDDARFLQAWVRLEALAKATGLGIGRILTAAGVVGGTSQLLNDPAASACTVRDLAVRAGCFAAVAADHLPQILAVEDFPVSAAGLAKFTDAAAGP